ncbi:MAG: alpha/beta hydrolase, partial [Bosea sp. (in: a-proteobacteria)]
DNPFLAAEALWVKMTEQSIDLWRDLRDMSFELAFYAMWSTPWARTFGQTHEARRTLKSQDELRALPEVAQALEAMGQGGFVEAVIRMIVLLADDQDQVSRNTLERTTQVLTQSEPFLSLGPDSRATIIHQQTMISTFEPERAVETLSSLELDGEERELSLKVAQFVCGPIDDMMPLTLTMLQRFRKVFDLGPLTDDVLENPLATEQDEAPPPMPKLNGAATKPAARRRPAARI